MHPRRFVVLLGVAVAAAILSTAACRRGNDPSVAGVFAKHQGVYRGFSPSDASPTQMGEFELTITGGKADIRFATGDKVVQDSAIVGSFVQMSKAEIKAEFDNVNDAEIDGMVVAYKPQDAGRPIFLYFKTNKTDADYDTLVILVGGMAEPLGPTILYTPSAVKAGKFEEGIRTLEARYGAGTIPRIAGGGKVSTPPPTN